MDREQMRMAILEQEQTFRQQVHELHRVYHVQKQLMREMQMSGSQAIVDDVDTKPKGPKTRRLVQREGYQPSAILQLLEQQGPASADECNLELTLATGSSSSSRSPKGKQVKSSNSDSGTAVSSTSTESELVQFKEFDVVTTVRFQSEGKRLADEMNQSPGCTSV